MGSNMKRTKIIRARKAKPNKKNIKTNMKRLQDNHDALKALTEEKED
jgi:hypothetical protein